MDIHEAARYAQKNANYLKDELSDDLKKAKETVCNTCGAAYDTTQNAKGNAENLIQNSLDSWQQKQENITAYVKENPVKSICYGLLAGFVASHLLRK